MLGRETLIDSMTLICDVLEKNTTVVLDGDKRTGMIELLTETLDYLKQPEVIAKVRGRVVRYYTCPKCESELDPEDQYCRVCGSAVRWI